jgi:DNA-directed RNA polymerase specialized sigma24 family protein
MVRCLNAGVSKTRLIITAAILESRPRAEIALAYGVSNGSVSKLVARYRAEGAAAFKREWAVSAGEHP